MDKCELCREHVGTARVRPGDAFATCDACVREFYLAEERDEHRSYPENCPRAWGECCPACAPDTILVPPESHWDQGRRFDFPRG